MAKLTDKQQRFVEEYLIDLNATQDAIRAGYSVKTADRIGPELLGKTCVLNEIEKAKAERSKRTGVTADRVIKELAKITFVNAKDIIDFKNASIIEDANDDDLAVVQSVKIKTSFGNVNTEEREIKLADKQKALELLGKHLGMFSDINVNMKNGIL